MRTGVAQGEIVSPVLFSLYVNDMLTPSRYVELATVRGRHDCRSHVPQPLPSR